LPNIEELKQKIRQAITVNKQIPTLMGDICISKQIGEGGNSIVYEATWGGRSVAVKIIALDYQVEKDSEKYKRFIDEFLGLIPLSKSDVIVPVYHFGLLENRYPFFVMELYPETLEGWIRNNPIQDIQTLVPIIERFLYCLNAIHAQGIVHRDIKPKNIFVDRYNRLLLGDFGIAWFDPEHYEKLSHTSTGDRLANYGFSAPEQFHRDNSPAPTMDIFSIGQIIQWMVTGNTHGGTERKQLRDIHESLGALDPFVDTLLAYDPQKRPQNAPEAHKILEKCVVDQEQQIVFSGWRCQEEFDHRLAEAQPGGRGLIELGDSQSYDRLLELLSDEPQKYELWWTRGLGNFQIIRLKKQPKDIWLMNQYEFQIKTVWLYRHPHALNKNFVLIKTVPLTSFGITGKTSDTTECAGYFDGHYFSREELEDGIAIINDKRVNLDSTAEVRCREMKPQFWFLSVRTSNILFMKNDEIVDRVYNSIFDRGYIENSDIEILNNTQKDPTLID